MVQLDRLWDYQQVDLEVDKVEATKRALPVRQQQLKLRKEMEEFRAQLDKVEREVETCHQRLAVLTRDLDTIEMEFGRDQAETKQIEDFEHAQNLHQNARHTIRSLQDHERELEGLVKAAADNDRKIRSIVGRYNKGKTTFDELKAEYDAAAAQIETDNKPLYDKLKAAEEQLEPALLQKYKNIKTNKPNVLVPLHGDRCGGCNMSMAALVLKNVNEGSHIVECENCGRIIYGTM